MPLEPGILGMIKKLPLSDFRAVRHKLEPDEFALSEGPNIAPTHLIDEETWGGITHLSDDVVIRTSDHNGHRLALLHSLWGDWITATGDPEKPDELFSCMLDAGDALQCTNFLFLHGYYRASMAELRVALELVMIGAYGNLMPGDFDYVIWKTSGSELGFTRFRRRMHGMLRTEQCKWLVADEEFPDKTFRQLCNFTHSRPNSSDGSLWQSNGPVYAHDAVMLTFFTTVSVYAICYLLIRIARPHFALPPGSRILFEEDWVPNREGVAKAFEQLYKERAVPPPLPHDRRTPIL